MSIAPRQLARALAVVEREEISLLAWGAVDAALTSDELESLVLDAQSAGDELASFDRREIIDGLLDRGLVLRVPGDGVQLFRSRMAETVRLLARLRQILPYEDWRVGRPLVADYRLALRPKVRPQRRFAAQAVIDRLVADGRIPGRRREEIARRYLQMNGDLQLALFQLDATSRVLGTADALSATGTVVTAGTGSGKTHAFYLPAFILVDELVHQDPSPHLKALALYPRQELLKDQLRAALRTAARLTPDAASRPITIGAWFTATPRDADDIARRWRKDAAGYRCPYLDCPECGGALVCRNPRVSTALQCTDCSTSVAANFVTTRAELQSAPPDMLFTTTESLNRQLGSTYARRTFGLTGQNRPRLCLLDEIHTYDGVHGAQVANLMRRWRRTVGSPVAFVGLSATLVNAEQFFSDLTGLPEAGIARVYSPPSEGKDVADEYLLALRHNPAAGTSPLSTTIQVAMLLPRMLDAPGTERSGGLFGSKVFAFTDRLDSVNRLYWDLLDAEGWWKPGRPQNRSPRTLANKRAPGGTDDAARDRAGQLWSASQILGHGLATDRQLSIDQTSSQNVGVDPTAQVVVATASLEVGFDDDDVGGVIQHRAPYDAARFLQRKGRAGRPELMRPWMVVVLSDLGRDRYAYQATEKLFAAELDARRLPYRNTYVRKMQATYVLMDWLATQLPNIGNVWTLLSRPTGSGGDSSESQLRIAGLLEEVLRDGPSRTSLENYLAQSLDLDERELETLLWSPPRPVITALLPTLIRRLRSAWLWNGSANADPGVGEPAPEFAPSRLFSRLLVPEIQITAPSPRPGAEARDDTMGLEQFLVDFAPGNVSRRFGSDDQRQLHWIPIPDDPHETRVRIDGILGTTTDGMAAIDGTAIEVRRPLAASLHLTPDAVSQFDRGQFSWQLRIDPKAREGIDLPVPSVHPWATIAAAMTAHLHRGGAPVEITRFAPSVECTSLRRGQRVVRHLDVYDDEDRIALGFSQEVDALRIDLAADLSEQCATALRDPSVVRARRWARVYDSFEEATDFDPEVSVYDRHWLRVGMLCCYLEHVAQGSTPSDAASAVARDLRRSLEQALDVLFERLDEHELDAHAAGQVGRTHARLMDLCAEPQNLAAIARRLALLTEEPAPTWATDEVRHAALAGAAAFVSAAQALHGDIDGSDFILDFDEGASGPAIWISETSPGGSGALERVVDTYLDNPVRFLHVLSRVIQPTDLEGVDVTANAVLDSHDPEVQSAFAAVRAAWSTGHDATAAALGRLRAACSHSGMALDGTVMAVLAGRVLAPGSSEQTDAAFRHIRSTWVQAEAAGGVEVDARVAAWLASLDGSFDVAIAGAQVSRRRRYTIMSSLLWPRGLEVRTTILEAPNRYAERASIDPILLRRVVAATSHEGIDGSAAQWRAELDDRLTRFGEAEVLFSADDQATVAARLLDMATEPTDVGYLLAYPVAESIEGMSGGVLMRVVLREALL